MGRGIAARVKRAYLPTIFLIVLALLYVLLSDFSFTPVVFLSILLLIILASKTNYFGNNWSIHGSGVRSMESLLVHCPCFTSLLGYTICRISLIGVTILFPFSYFLLKRFGFRDCWPSSLLVSWSFYLFISFKEKRNRLAKPLMKKRPWRSLQLMEETPIVNWSS